YSNRDRQFADGRVPKHTRARCSARNESLTRGWTRVLRVNRRYLGGAHLTSPLVHQLEDVREDLGYSTVQMCRYFLADIRRLIESLCECLILHNRDLMLKGDCADAVGEIVLAFGDRSWRGHCFDVVSDGDRVMGRVHDQGGGLGHLPHHVAPGHIPLNATN